DEAHTLEDVAAEHMGLGVTRGQVDYQLNRLYSERRGRAHGLLTIHGDQEAVEQVYAVRLKADAFFDRLQAWRAAQPRPQPAPRRRPAGKAGAPPSESVRVREKGIVEDVLSGELEKLGGMVGRLAEKVKSEEEQIELSAAATRCERLGAEVRAWLGQGLPG